MLLSLTACIADESTVSGDPVASDQCGEPLRTAATRSLEKGLSSGLFSPIESVDGGRLLETVSDYFRARDSKDIDRILSFLEESADREEVRRFYESELPEEVLRDYQIVAVQLLKGTTADYQVFAVVEIEVSSRCYEDVLTTRWRRTADGWRLLPVHGIQLVSRPARGSNNEAAFRIR
jgi:hypothetical protein